ncbi:hypothetical protein [Joostella sp. CR20]|uniref:hypothetical protein n=1 Tax=Joostella sp. CR20 TaxID=2804312 RepID=UPI00313A8789
MKPLNGQCEEDFASWAKENNTLETFLGELALRVGMVLVNFYDLPTPMQFGVIQEFADSKGFEIYIHPYTALGEMGIDLLLTDGTLCVLCYNKKGEFIFDLIDLETRQEAQKQAIIKFNEIYNNQK